MLDPARGVEKELHELSRDATTVSGITVNPASAAAGDSIAHLLGSIAGPIDTPYKDQYPYEPPKMRFVREVRIQNAIKDADLLLNGTKLFTPDAHSATKPQKNNDASTSPSLKLSRILNALPVRRSLVRSFEESLLSGRLASGSISKKIDGFLAVLSVTGGSFSQAT